MKGRRKNQWEGEQARHSGKGPGAARQSSRRNHLQSRGVKIRENLSRVGRIYHGHGGKTRISPTPTPPLFFIVYSNYKALLLDLNLTST